MRPSAPTSTCRRDRLIDQLRAGALRLRDVRGGVVLRLDRADRDAGAAAAAGRTVVVPLRIARLRRRLHRVRRARERLRQRVDRRSYSGIGGSGYGRLRGASRSASRSPATPSSCSASQYQGSRSSYEIGQSTPTPNLDRSRKSSGTKRSDVPEPVPGRAANLPQVGGFELVGPAAGNSCPADRSSSAARTAGSDTAHSGTLISAARYCARAAGRETRGPASRMSTLTPRAASRAATRAPHTPEPTMHDVC